MQDDEIGGRSPEGAGDESADPRRKLVSVVLDEASIGRGNADQEHERLIAIYDLVECNCFALPNHEGGPYALLLAMEESRLAFDIRGPADEPIIKHILSLSPFRRLLKDYFMICESYYAAIRTATPSQIEAIDMGRRGLHNEGAALLTERLVGKIEFDFDTSRRLFTLITALHWKG
jgi:uncharacterized protein (UPF0262 family)